MEDIRTQEAQEKGLKAKIFLVAQPMKHGYSAMGLRSNNRFLSREENLECLRNKLIRRGLIKTLPLIAGDKN